jgi:hypothetical protein
MALKTCHIIVTADVDHRDWQVTECHVLPVPPQAFTNHQNFIIKPVRETASTHSRRRCYTTRIYPKNYYYKHCPVIAACIRISVLSQSLWIIQHIVWCYNLSVFKGI